MTSTQHSFQCPKPTHRLHPFKRSVMIGFILPHNNTGSFTDPFQKNIATSSLKDRTIHWHPTPNLPYQGIEDA